jgi:hypothetical protein
MGENDDLNLFGYIILFICLILMFLDYAKYIYE